MSIGGLRSKVAQNADHSIGFPDNSHAPLSSMLCSSRVCQPQCTGVQRVKPSTNQQTLLHLAEVASKLCYILLS